MIRWLNGLCFIGGTPAKDVAGLLRPGHGLKLQPPSDLAFCFSCRRDVPADKMSRFRIKRFDDKVGLCMECKLKNL